MAQQEQILCEGCNWSIINFTLMCEDKDKFQQFLRSHRLLAENIKCKKCNNMAVKSPDGFWRCQRNHRISPKKKTVVCCNFKLSVKSQSIFANSHLPQKTICLFFVTYLTLPPPRCELLMRELNISRQTYIHWASFCREVFVFWSEENCEKVGGEGKTVEIDEAKFGKRKYHRGRIIDGQWVFGGIERESKKMFCVAVPRRDTQTLIDVIQKWILPGTTIISDCWKAYNKLGELPFTHLTVNHSQNFVDPTSGAHTQGIERKWRDARGLIPQFGRCAEHYDGYLAEFLFKNFHKENGERLHVFLKYASKMNPGFAILEEH